MAVCASRGTRSRYAGERYSSETETTSDSPVEGGGTSNCRGKALGGRSALWMSIGRLQ